MLFQHLMENQTLAISPRSSLVHLWPWLMLVLVLLFVGFIRFRLLDMPLERDEGEYAYAGQLILQGIPPYELAYNMKLPGTYYACALGMSFFGQTIAGMHATLLVVNSLTTLFVFLLGRKLFGDLVAVIAGASYALMSVSPAVLGMATHANQFVVLFAVPAMLFLWTGCERKSNLRYFLSGLLCGLAFLMKQQGIFFGVFGGAYLVWVGMRNRNVLAAVKTILFYSAGILVPYLGLCLLMAWEGVFSRFWFWTFTYAHSYVGLVTLSEGFDFLSRHLETVFLVAVGFWLLGGVGLLCGLLDKTLREKTLFVGGILVFGFFGAATGLYFRPHYFILMLPAFSLLIGLAVEKLPKKLPARLPHYFGKAAILSVFLALCGWRIYYERQYLFIFSGKVVNQVIYKDFPFVESIAVSDYIREHSTPAARIAVIGSEPQIYFYAQRRSATGYIYIYPLNEPQPSAHAMQLDMIREIEAAKPQYIVWVGFINSWLIWPNTDQILAEWGEQYIRKYYEKTGIVYSTTNGYTVCLWDEDARNYNATKVQHITIYKLKDAAESSFKKN